MRERELVRAERERRSHKSSISLALSSVHALKRSFPPFPLLQYIAVCCSVLQYIAVCCSVQQCVAVCRSVLLCVRTRSRAPSLSGLLLTAKRPHFVSLSLTFIHNLSHTIIHTPRSPPLHFTETHRNTLQHTAPHCNTLQHPAAHSNPQQHIATHCNTLQHTATHSNTLQHTATH